MSNDWLNKEEFVPFAPKARGESVMVHHCKKGKNNNRLYIRRNEDGSIVAYCHHCCKRGFSTLDGIANIHSKDTIKPTTSGVKVLKLPHDLELRLPHWPIEALKWVSKYGITTDELDINSIGYSNSWMGVVLPVFDTKGRLVCTQTRRFSWSHTEIARGQTKKYDTTILQGTQKSERLFIPRHRGPDLPDRPNTLVLVEDILSSIKIDRVTDAMALLGTSLPKEKYLTLGTKYDKIVIWLDNDNPQVRKSQSKIKRRLELFCPDVQIIYTERDPKEHTQKEIEAIVND